MDIKNQGFTLIELIVVIVILGVLAAVAAPRFIDVNSDARIATLESLEGSMREAARLVNLSARLEKKTICSRDLKIETKDNITLKCGYPCPHPDGIGNAVVTDSNFKWIGGNCGGFLGYVEVQLINAQEPENCKIRYSAARSETTPPNITSTITGC